MKLYGNYTSPFVRHCRVALLQQKLDCDFVEIDYAMTAKKFAHRQDAIPDRRRSDADRFQFNFEIHSGKIRRNFPRRH